MNIILGFIEICVILFMLDVIMLSPIPLNLLDKFHKWISKDSNIDEGEEPHNL